jgi:hypothetical protein
MLFFMASSLERRGSGRPKSGRSHSVPRPGSFGKAWLFLPFLLWLGSGCTLMSVGNTVKKDFAPALSRGDVPTLVRHSTPELGELFARFTQAEIQQLLRWGTTPPPSKTTKTDAKSTPTKISGSLDDFTSSGNRARLRVKSGPVRYTFVMHHLGGRWRVHDILIHRKAGDWSFQQILSLFLSAKELLAAARLGQVDPVRTDPALAAALAPVVARLPAWGLLQKKESVDDESVDDDGPLLAFVNLVFRDKGAVVSWRIAGIPVDLSLRREKNLWVLEDAVARVEGRPPLGLAATLRALGPALVALGDMRWMPGSGPYAWDRVRALLHDDLAASLSPVLTPVWRPFSPLLSSRFRKVPGASDPGGAPSRSGSPARRLREALGRLNWSREGQDLVLSLEAGTWGVRTRWSDSGRLTNLVVMTGRQEIRTRHLAGFAPFSRWWDSLLTGQVSDPARWLHEGLRLLDEPYAGLEPLVPRTLTLPPGLFALLRATWPPAKGKAAPDKDARPAPDDLAHLPPVRLEHFSFTPERTELEIGALGRRFLWVWRWRQETWRLASLQVDRSTDLLPVLWLLPPAWRAVEGFNTRSAPLLTSALSDPAAGRLGPGLAVLFDTHGKWLGELVDETLELLRLKLNQPPQWKEKSSTPANDPGPAATEPVLDARVRTLTVGGRTLAFSVRQDGAWGLTLPEPPAVKSRTTIGDHALAIVELWPTLAGLYLGLAASDTTALARFSSTDFTRKVWRKLPGKKLATMLDRLGVEIPPVTGQAVVDLLFPGHAPVVPVPEQGSASDVFSGLRRLAGGAPVKALPKVARQVVAAGGKTRSPSVRILGTLVRSDRRYPFAEIWLLVDGRRIDFNFSWDASRKIFVLNEVRAQVKVLGRDMTFGLKDNLNTFL